MKFIFWTAVFFYRFLSAISREKPQEPQLAISAGAKGWESIEFKELYASAIEWLGPDKVKAVIFNPDISVRKELDGCSHFFYDPRTGYDYDKNYHAQRLGCCLRALKIGIICAWRGIALIAYDTDFSKRDWRQASYLASADKGFIFTLISSLAIPKSELWHSRVCGPMPLALSSKLSNSFESRPLGSRNTLISFSGSLYEPRTSFINELKDKCHQDGIDLLVNSKNIGGERRSDSDYWSDLLNSIFVVSTSSQSTEDELDFPEIKQMIYRFSEVLMTGACLISDVPDGVGRYFKSGEHFVAATTVNDVIEILHDYKQRPEYYSKIAQRGQKKAQAIADCSYFWNTINNALGSDSIQ